LLPRKDIQYAPTARILAPGGDLWSCIIARRIEEGDDLFDGNAPTFFQSENSTFHRARRVCGGFPLSGVQHHHLVAAAPRERPQQIQALGFGLRIGQSLVIRNLQIRKKPHPVAPSRQFRCEFLLAFDIPTHDPHASFDFSDQQSRKEGLSSLCHLGDKRANLGFQQPCNR
jgi:hypothetical protein